MAGNASEVSVEDYTLVFDFEKEFRYRQMHDWLLAHWHHSFYYAAAYMVAIWSGKQVMNSRPKFELRQLLFVWNVALALFSIFTATRTFSELLYVLREFGFYHSVCRIQLQAHENVFGLWAWAFALSKVAELGDTAFIVLRKQPLLFLHWYHHITVLLYVWFSTAFRASTGRWFLSVNCIVHAFMYSYYALKVLKWRIPRWISMFITVAQLSQMAVGVFVNVQTLLYKRRGDECQVSDSNITASLFMYLSYFVLFSHFFYNAYVNKKISSRKTGQKTD